MIESKIIAIILLIFSFILIFGFLYQFYAKMAEHANEEACRGSIVLTQSLAEKIEIAGTKPAEYGKPWPATCRTEDKIIKTDDPEKAKKELAELMTWCWWMMGEGVIKPFDKDFWYTERKCFVCYTVRFPNIKEPIMQPDFMFYLREKGKKDKTYYDYLGYESNTVLKSALTDPIDNQRVYGVIYISPAEKAFGNVATCLATYTTLAVAVGSVSGGTGGVVVGAIGALRCGSALALQILESMKDDLVYVTDVNRGMGGCEGGFAFGTRVETA